MPRSKGAIISLPTPNLGNVVHPIYLDTAIYPLTEPRVTLNIECHPRYAITYKTHIFPLPLQPFGSSFTPNLGNVVRSLLMLFLLLLLLR